MNPKDLGLPAKFSSFRPHQIDALEKILASDKRFILLQAPTGAGKSLLMAAVAKSLKSQVLYTCQTHQLQEQVLADFDYAEEMKGRSNYPCLKGNDYTANECTAKVGNSKSNLCKKCSYGERCIAKDSKSPVKKCPCWEACPYVLQKQRTLNAELAILNTAYFLNEANFAGDFSGWKWIVLDEGDLTENALMSFIEVSITARQIENLRMAPPAKKTVAAAWFEWAKEHAMPTIQSRINYLESEGGTALDIREQKDLERLMGKLRFLITQSLDRWVFIPEEYKWTFKPVWVSPYAENYLWGHGVRFLIMSATILSPTQFARDLGIPKEDVEFIDMPSTFLAENRPIIYRPEANMSHRNKDIAWPEMVKAIDEVLTKHPDEKGLIHTVSYPLARYIYDNSAFKERLVQHDSKTRITELERFKSNGMPVVMISPSMERGVDLAEDFCRFLVIAKVPFPNLGDLQVSRRLHSAADGPLWYAVQTIRSIIQATGRGVRSESDYCVNYILDEQFGRLYRDHCNLFPGWWRQALHEKSQ